MIKKVAYIVAALALVIGVVSAVLGLMGYLFVTLKYPNDTAMVQRVACDTGIIDSYNALKAKSGDMSTEDMNSELSTIGDKITSINGYDKDLTCLYILFDKAALALNVEDTERYARDINTLADQGAYLSPRLVDAGTISDIDRRVEVIKMIDAEQIETENLGSG